MRRTSKEKKDWKKKDAKLRYKLHEAERVEYKPKAEKKIKEVHRIFFFMNSIVFMSTCKPRTLSNSRYVLHVLHGPGTSCLSIHAENQLIVIRKFKPVIVAEYYENCSGWWLTTWRDCRPWRRSPWQRHSGVQDRPPILEYLLLTSNKHVAIFFL